MTLIDELIDRFLGPQTPNPIREISLQVRAYSHHEVWLAERHTIPCDYHRFALYCGDCADCLDRAQGLYGGQLVPSCPGWTRCTCPSPAR